MRFDIRCTVLAFVLAIGASDAALAHGDEHGAKKKYELLIIKDGNHSLSRFEWRQTLLTKLEAFLAANN